MEGGEGLCFTSDTLDGDRLLTAGRGSTPPEGVGPASDSEAAGVPTGEKGNGKEMRELRRPRATAPAAAAAAATPTPATALPAVTAVEAVWLSDMSAEEDNETAGGWLGGKSARE